MTKPCFCGSGLPRRELKDGYGIFLTFACDKCEREKMSEFRSDIREQYDTDEPIEDPDYPRDSRVNGDWDDNF